MSQAWEGARLRYWLEANDGGVWGEDPTEGCATPVLRSTDITVDGRWELTEPAHRCISEDEQRRYRLQEGDLLVTKSSGSPDHIGKTALVTPEIERMQCAYSNFMQRLRPASASDPRFIHYVLNNDFGREQLRFLSQTTTGLRNLNGSMLGEIRLPVASADRQSTIADFLDRETGRIDALVEKKRRLIELLEEKRTALISHIVTKGLDPTAPMKNSGIPWLGEIPAHWETRKLRYVASLRSGTSITSDDIEAEGEYPVFGGNGLRGYTSTYTHTGEYPLIGRQGALCGNINYAQGEFFASEHAVVATPLIDAPATWLGETLRAMELGRYSKAAAQPGLAVDVIAGLSVPVPPRDERVRMAERIDNSSNGIDSTVSSISRQLGLIAEYRRALVTAAVTGQIDVNAQAPDPEEALA